MSETSIEPQSVRADVEEAETPAAVKQWRILQRREGSVPDSWLELPPLSGPYGDLPPEPGQIGPAYGEGEYLVIEGDSKYTFHSTYVIRVVAEKLWLHADEDAEVRS